MTNVLSQSLEVLVVDVHLNDLVDPHDLDPHPGIFPFKGKILGIPTGNNPSLFAPLPHNIVKNDIDLKINNNHENNTTRPRFSTLHSGGTTHKPHPTLIPKLVPTTTNTRPPTSGSHGDSGRTIPNTQAHPIHPSGLTIHNLHPATTLHMNPLPNHLRHSPRTSSDHTSPPLRKKQQIPVKSGDDQTPTPVTVPHGHMRGHQPTGRIERRVDPGSQVCIAPPCPHVSSLRDSAREQTSTTANDRHPGVWSSSGGLKKRGHTHPLGHHP